MSFVLLLSLALNVLLGRWAIRVWRGRRRICASFRNESRINGKCQCPYCRGDADDLAELAAGYEMDLFSLRQKYEPL